MKKIIELNHGAGGRMMDDLIENLTSRYPRTSLGEVGLLDLDDGATIPKSDSGSVITADSHTVDPLFFPAQFFPEANIGHIACAGTLNDLSVMGAVPTVLTVAVIVEEGLELNLLEKVTDTIGELTSTHNVTVLAGDTKVMPRGSLDKMVLSTSGIGVLRTEKAIKDKGIQVGDKIIVSGTVGDHGMTLLTLREGLRMESSTLRSDVVPLVPMISELFTKVPYNAIHAMKDVTRGGFVCTVTDFAKKSQVGLSLVEEAIPIRDDVLAACEIFGIDPFHVSCEGKIVLAVDPEFAEEVLHFLTQHKYGLRAAQIGEAVETTPGRVIIETPIGGHRYMEKPIGEPIPRVC